MFLLGPFCALYSWENIILKSYILAELVLFVIKMTHGPGKRM